MLKSDPSFVYFSMRHFCIFSAWWYTGAEAAQRTAASPRGGAFKAEGDLGQPVTPRPMTERLSDTIDIRPLKLENTPTVRSTSTATPPITSEIARPSLSHLHPLADCGACILPLAICPKFQYLTSTTSTYAHHPSCTKLVQPAY